MIWHSHDPQEVLNELQVDTAGLTTEAATAKHTAENITEIEVTAEAAKATAEAACTEVGVNTCVTVLIIAGLLIAV